MEGIDNDLQKRIKDREAIKVENPIKGWPDKIEEPSAIICLPEDPGKKPK